MAESLFRKRTKDESYLQTLRKLISEQDELVFSAFEVFKSDYDEDDLYDTLNRIIQLSWQRKRSSPKNRIEDQQTQAYKPSTTSKRFENGFGSHERGRKFERAEDKTAVNRLSRTKSPLPRDFSYFLRQQLLQG